MPSRTESPSAQLGQLLLRGWTMQAESCAECQVPLMRDPATMLSHCVSCRRIYNADGDIVQDNAEQPTVPEGGAAASASPQQPTMNGPVAVAGRNGSNAPAAAATEDATSLTGSQQQQQQQQQPPLADDQDPGFEQARQRYLQLRQQREAAAAVAGGHDPCQVLADRLLEGWTLLAEHCPICRSPLMRSRARQVRCVVCDLPVQIESRDAAAAAATGAAPRATAAGEERNGPVAPAATTTAAAAAPTAETVGLAMGNVPVPVAAQAPAVAQQQPVYRSYFEDGWGDAATQHQQQQRQHQPAEANGLLGEYSCSPLLLQQPQVLSGLQQALLRKLEEAKQALLAIPAVQTVELDKQLQLIKNLLHTLVVVKWACHDS